MNARVDVLRVDRRGQAVLHVVGDRDRLVEAIGTDHRHDRAENLFLRDRASSAATSAKIVGSWK